MVTERLDLTEEGRAMAQAVLGCHIREQMHCLRCGKDTRQKSYCQYLFTASASGLREQASVMRHGDDERDQTPCCGESPLASNLTDGARCCQTVMPFRASPQSTCSCMAAPCCADTPETCMYSFSQPKQNRLEVATHALARQEHSYCAGTYPRLVQDRCSSRVLC